MVEREDWSFGAEGTEESRDDSGGIRYTFHRCDIGLAVLQQLSKPVIVASLAC